MKLVQLNAQVTPAMARKIREDARENQKTLASVVEVILREFFLRPAGERAKAYNYAQAKLTGRPVS